MNIAAGTMLVGVLINMFVLLYLGWSNLQLSETLREWTDAIKKIREAEQRMIEISLEIQKHSIEVMLALRDQGRLK